MADDKRQNPPGQNPPSQDPIGRPVTPRDRPEPNPGSQRIADEPVADPDAPDASVRKPTTETGLPVEEQVRKEWDANKDGGLPTPLRDAVR